MAEEERFLQPRLLPLAGALLLAALALTAGRAEAHQPYFEDTDYTSEAPRVIQDPEISTALYATLDRPDDVDYYRFTGKAGQAIPIRIDIPQVKGQERFAPTVALMGSGLPAARLPKRVTRPEGAGAQLLEPPSGEPPAFYEPFTRTTYWTRQDERVTLPADGDYWLAVYHPEGAQGHYTLSVGEQEAIGGDLLFPLKIKRYFKPVPAARPAAPARE